MKPAKTRAPFRLLIAVRRRRERVGPLFSGSFFSPTTVDCQLLTTDFHGWFRSSPLLRRPGPQPGAPYAGVACGSWVIPASLLNAVGWPTLCGVCTSVPSRRTSGMNGWVRPGANHPKTILPPNPFLRPNPPTGDFNRHERLFPLFFSSIPPDLSEARFLCPACFTGKEGPTTDASRPH